MAAARRGSFGLAGGVSANSGRQWRTGQIGSFGAAVARLARAPRPACPARAPHPAPRPASGEEPLDRGDDLFRMRVVRGVAGPIDDDDPPIGEALIEGGR